MIIAKTTAVCRRCEVPHDAKLVREGSQIRGIVDCPEGADEYEVSSDAGLYLELRRRSQHDSGRLPQGDLRYVLNYISITNACNLSCAVCGADAVRNDREAAFLPVSEIVSRARKVAESGGRLLHLIGGEPTLHPGLPEIIKQLSAMGLSVGIVTNGLVLGSNPQLAKQLARCGLARVCLQFDSFDKDVLKCLGRDFLDAKKAAIRYVADARIGLGLNCTVSKHNLEELGVLLAHGLELGQAVRNMTFASAAPIARFDLDPSDSADREQIVKQLVSTGQRWDLSLDDVQPLVCFLPWGLQVHPDCGVHIVFIRTLGRIRSLNHFVDQERLYQLLRTNQMKAGAVSRYIVPLVYGLRCIRRGKFLAVLKIAMGLLRRSDSYSVVNVGVSNYRAAMFLDEQRLARCASAFHTSVGPVRGCEHFFRDCRHPGSREYEVEHGSC